jgi:WD40 repeat protein
MRYLKAFIPVLLAMVLVACGAQPPVINLSGQSVEIAGIDPESPLATSALISHCNTTCQLLPADLLTSKPVPHYTPIEVGMYYTTALSPDGKTMALVSYPHNEFAYGGRLSLVDLETWKQVETPIEVNDFVYSMTFSPDGKRLAMVTSVYEQPEWPLAMIDVQNRTIIAKTTFNIAYNKIQFTPDNTQLMAYGVDTPSGKDAFTEVAIYQTDTLERVWQQTLPDIIDGYFPTEDPNDPTYSTVGYTPGVVFEPGGQLLYIVHADSDTLTTVDFASRSVKSVAIEPPQSVLDRLMALTLTGTARAKALEGTYKTVELSPDGKRLYVGGTEYVTVKDEAGNITSYDSIPLKLMIVDTASGTELKRTEFPASELSLSHDGRQLYIAGWDDTGDPYASTWTQVLDTETFTEVKLLTNAHLTPAYQLDGQPILLESHMLPDGKGQLSVLDMKTFEVRSSFAEWGNASWLVLP